MDKSTWKAAYELIFEGKIDETLTDEEVEEVRMLADYLSCPSCGD